MGDLGVELGLSGLSVVGKGRIGPTRRGNAGEKGARESEGECGGEGLTECEIQAWVVSWKAGFAPD